ncbi:MAG: S9 family peptidase [Chitinophagaceae bacterium]|nr:S9 family peptidase [Chitinophagaceae bacterium]
MKKLLFLSAFLLSLSSFAQNNPASKNGVMTPELLWKLGRVSGLGISTDGKYVLYSVSTPNAEANKSSRKKYMVPVTGGNPLPIDNTDSLLTNEKISPDGKYLISNAEVKVKKVTGKEYYSDLQKSNVYIFDNLNYRHWDTYEDGNFDHVMLTPLTNGIKGTPIDLMPGEPYDCPQKPFGGDEDYVWNPNGKEVLYCTKKKYGTAYAVSTNTDLFAYDIETRKTRNVTEGMMGYDVNPSFSKSGVLAWLSMRRDGFESDKQDIVVSDGQSKMNLTTLRDDIHVESFRWADDGKSIYFIAAVNGTRQLFVVSYPGLTRMLPRVSQLTRGDFDVNGIVGQSGNTIIVSRTDMNHAAEIYTVNSANGEMAQLTHVNDETYASIGLSKTERRFVKTTDGKNMLVWVIYPPGFDATKKYPALLYCQGGPQSSLTQSYSTRWNFQLMAARGYIVVAPSRRGMPGFGTKWNEDISKEHGGQAMQDYLSAIDALSKEKYVDKNRLGCVGASYGGYSVFMLAGMHNNRFKSFISHDGIFDFKSMYGTTEELWFVDWDYGGAYWDMSNQAAQKSYTRYSPSNFVQKWNTPILIFQGGKDYRVPIEQGQQAFQAAQLRGIKSKFILLPDQNHWVLTAQDALVWQREFFGWLDETLK